VKSFDFNLQQEIPLLPAPRENLTMDELAWLSFTSNHIPCVGRSCRSIYVCRKQVVIKPETNGLMLFLLPIDTARPILSG
jgi:hypothetical protein